MMFAKDIGKLSESAENKLRYMDRSPLGYILLSALAGIYLGFGITLIFAVGGPIAEAGGAAYLRLIMGACFGVALSLVIFAGAELFTGNNMVFAIGRLNNGLAYRQIGILFALCFLGNLIGSVFLAWLVVLGGSLPASSEQLIMKVAAVKMHLTPKQAFLRGVLCNWLVCLAVWVANRSQSESARLIMIFWCLFAFVGSGFEHSIANQSLLSLALFLPHGADITISGFIHNQVFVTLGNLVGGGMMVGIFYAFIHSDAQPEKKRQEEVVCAAKEPAE